MKTYRLITSIGLLVSVLFVLVPGKPAQAETDALIDCVWHLSPAVEALGPPQAGEVISERNEIKSLFDQLRLQALENSRQREKLASEKQKLDRANREREDKMRQIDFEEKVLVQEWDNLNQRRRLRNAEALKFQEAKAATDVEDEAAVARINAWAEEGTASLALLMEEKSKLEERDADIQARREAIAADIVVQAQYVATMFKYRYVVDQETTRMIRECSALTMRAIALKQITNAPARAIEYRPPDEMAKKLLKDLGENLAKEASGNFLTYSQTGKRVLSNPAVLRQFAKIGIELEVLPVVAAFSVADISTDSALAGANQREREVVKNIYLIGDYANAMKLLIKLKGKHAKQTTEYKAIVFELERLQADMPKDDWSFFKQSLNNSAFLGNAFLGMASKYISDKAGLRSTKITNHLNNAERKTLGEGGVVFFRESFRTVRTAEVDTLIKTSALQASDAYSIQSQAPVPQPPVLQLNPPGSGL
ncbi:MAG: hypothetical protein ABI644_06540 [Arenimonas sp.]